MYDKIKLLKEKIKSLPVLFKKIPKERKILGIVLILLIASLLYQSLIAVQILRLRPITFQFMSQKKLVDSYHQLMGHTDALISETEQNLANLKQIKERFAEEERLSDYFANFRSMLREHNLKIVSLDLKPQEVIMYSNRGPLTHYQKLRFDVSIKGGYFNIMSLLYKLQQDKPILDINSIYIKQENQAPDEVVMDMGATIYILMKRS